MRSGALSGSLRCSDEPSSCWGMLASPSSATRLVIRGCVSGQNQVGPRSITPPDAATERMRPPSRKRFRASATPHNPPPTIAVSSIDQPYHLVTDRALQDSRKLGLPDRMARRSVPVGDQLAQNLIIRTQCTGVRRLA